MTKTKQHYDVILVGAGLLMKGYKIGWHPVDEYNKELTRLNGRF